MVPRHLALALQVALEADVVLYVHGTAGIGKSEIIEQVGAEQGYYVEDLRLATQEAVDLIGRLTEREIEYMGETALVSTWSMPEWLWKAKVRDQKGQPTLVFLDELNRASKDVRQAAYQFVLKKQLHLHQAPESLRIVVAGNPPTIDYDVEEIDDSMRTRYIHVRADVDARQWVQDYAHNNCHPAVTEFIASAPHYLAKEEGERFDVTAEAINRPRTWKFLSDVYSAMESMDLFAQDPMFCQALLWGCVGAGPANEFLQSLKSDWVTLEDLLNGKVSWADVSGKGTADVRLCHQISNSLRYSDFTMRDGGRLAPKQVEMRRQRFVQFLRDGSADKKDAIMGLVRALHNSSGDPKLVKWLRQIPEVAELIMSTQGAIATAGLAI